MTYLDRYLQKQRMDKVLPWIQPGDRVLDIGCAEGRLLKALQPHPHRHVGIDPDLKEALHHQHFQCLPIHWQEADLNPQSFQVITLLAVWEHIPTGQQPQLIQHMKDWLQPGGKIILTIPHARVDQILPWLQRFGLIQGMHLEEHYGFDLKQTIPLFLSMHCKLMHHQSFQLGLNHLFVFQT